MTIPVRVGGWWRKFPADRWILRSFVIVHVLMALFVVFVSYDLLTAEKQRTRNTELALQLAQQVQEDTRTTACYGAEQRRLYLLVADAWGTQAEVQKDPVLSARLVAERARLVAEIARDNRELKDC
jgi:hypothetical protein